MPVIAMRLSFSGRLCQKQEPERGCLSRSGNLAVSVPKDKCPILSLPPEIRAQIFQYLIDEVDLIFKCSKQFVSSSCWVSWSEYRSNVAFIEACKAFEKETMRLVQVRSITVELEAMPDPRPLKWKTDDLFTTYKHSSPRSLSLSIQAVRPHLQRLVIDSRYALGYLLQTNFLDEFPRLREICIKQRMWPRAIDFRYRSVLESKSEQRRLIEESLRDSVGRDSMGKRWPLSCKYDGTKLVNFLSHKKLNRFYPITVDTSARSLDRYSEDWPTDECPTYPIRGAISAFRLSYQWPSLALTKLEVDMYHQPMALAVKSTWSEAIPFLGDALIKCKSAKELT